MMDKLLEVWHRFVNDQQDYQSARDLDWETHGTINDSECSWNLIILNTQKIYLHTTYVYMYICIIHISQ